MNPVIGITCWIDYEKSQYFVPQEYAKAIEKVGGLPVILPPVETEEAADRLLGTVDGLLLSGGVDLDPAFWGEEPMPRLGKISPERDRSELMLANKALALDVPVLGICRGHQVIAVAGGGSLYQDIPSQLREVLKHSQDAPRWYATHAVTVQPGTRMAAWLGAGTVRVNSFHHQAIRDLPKGFVVSAEAVDGIIEAIEDTRRRFVVGVQWHPECFWNKEDTFDPIFRTFVEAARGARVVG
jgi:putative glutamine amidotransferase